MPTTSSRAGIPAPGLAEAPNGPVQMQALADRVDALLNAAPMSGVARDGLSGTDRFVGRTIWNTTSGQFEVWDGSVWQPQLPVAGGTLTGDLGLHSYRERRRNENTGSWQVSFDGHGLLRNAATGAMSVSWSGVPSSSEQVRSVTLLLAGPPSSVTWPAATRFADGEPPEVDGETWLAAVATGGQVTVFPVGVNVGTA